MAYDRVNVTCISIFIRQAIAKCTGKIEWYASSNICRFIPFNRSSEFRNYLIFIRTGKEYPYDTPPTKITDDKSSSRAFDPDPSF